MPINFKTTVEADLDAMTLCYQRAFPLGLAAAFGSAYVRRTLQWFLAVDQNFLFHIRDDQGSGVIGFCGGMLNDGITPRGSASEMIQFAFNKGLLALVRKPWLLFHPEMRSKYSLAWKNVRKRFLPRKKDQARVYSPGAVQPFAGLVVIGVDPAHQNKGIGGQLIREFERRAAEMGYRKMKLSVKVDNVQAIRAYEKCGWKLNEVRGNSASMIKITNG